MKTGQSVEELGLYSSEYCNEELIFVIGDAFARCPRCQHLCVWELEDEIVTAEELERENGMAA